MRLEPFNPASPPNPIAGDATLDEVLAHNADRAPDARALVAPELGFPGTWREIDRAVSSLARMFLSWELGEDATVGVQLGSSPHAALTVLALWRAGLVPAMLPLAWRRREGVAALSSVGATAIVAATEGAGARLAEAACEIAAGLETIRYVGCFGPDAPDGATPLDEALDGASERCERPDRPDDAADHVAIVTFDAGGAPVARSHNELVAAGVMPYAAARMTGRSALLCTMDLASLAGLATGLAPWLTAGCAASFHQAAGAGAVARAVERLGATHVTLPGRVAAGLAAEGAFGSLSPTVIAVWRAPDGRGPAHDVPNASLIVDALMFGELGLYAAARERRDRHPALPLGPAGPAGLDPLLETTVTPDGRFTVRGAVCPRAACPSSPGVPGIAFDPKGFLETGLAGVADRAAGRASLGGRRLGVLQIGGLAVAVADLDAAYHRSGAGDRPPAQADPVFGSRLAIEGDDAAAACARASAALADAGFGPAFAPVAASAMEPAALKSA